jgi:hypothetical protein
LRGGIGKERTIGEVLELLVDTDMTEPEQPPPRDAEPVQRPSTRVRRART